MMWFASLLLFISIGGCFCDPFEDELECFLKMRDKCGEEELPTEVPQTGEELLAFCRDSISMRSCHIEVAETCTDDSDYYFNRDRNALDYLKALCQEDNPTFKVITNNLPCIERVLKSRPKTHCSGYVSDKHLEAIRTHMKPFISDDSNEDLAYCLFDLMDVTCEGIAFGYHCGAEVKNAVEQIEAHVHSPRSLQCTPEQLEELSAFMRIFEDLLLEDITLNDLMGKRK